MPMEVSGPPWVVRIRGGVPVQYDPTDGQLYANGSPVSGDGVNRAKRGVDIFAPGLGVTPTVTQSNVTINSSGFVTIDGEQWFQVVGTATAGGAFFEINIPAFLAVSANTAVVEYQTDPAQGSPMYLYLGTTAYAKNANWSWNFVAPTVNEPLHHYGRAAMHCYPSGATKGGGFTEDVSAVPWTIAKVRIPVTNGLTRTFNLRSITVAPTQAKGRLCIVADDGYSNWLRLGVPIMEEFGLVTTSALIADVITAAPTTGQYASIPEWRAYLDRGHEIVAHGPRFAYPNLIDNYATNAQSVADALWNRDTLDAMGLLTPEARRCFILPQGKYGRSAGDVSLLDDLRAAGLDNGRGAILKLSQCGFYARGTSARSHARMVWPVLGHNYAGAANTADDANETTNINNIIAAIQGVAANRADAHLMLHRVVPRGQVSVGGTIEIETDRLRTLAAAIRAEVDAGRLETVKMSALNY